MQVSDVKQLTAVKRQYYENRFWQLIKNVLSLDRAVTKHELNVTYIIYNIQINSGANCVKLPRNKNLGVKAFASLSFAILCTFT